MIQNDTNTVTGISLETLQLYNPVLRIEIAWICLKIVDGPLVYHHVSIYVPYELMTMWWCTHCQTHCWFMSRFQVKVAPIIHFRLGFSIVNHPFMRLPPMRYEIPIYQEDEKHRLIACTTTLPSEALECPLLFRGESTGSLKSSCDVCIYIYIHIC